MYWGKRKARLVVGPADWCMYLVNGTWDLYSEEERKLIKQWLRLNVKNHEAVCDAGPAFLTYQYPLYTGNALGPTTGYVCQYTVIG